MHNLAISPVVALRIPPNTTAEVELPGAALAALLENGQPFAAADALERPVATVDGVRIVLGSGHYHFSYPYTHPGKQA